MKQLLHLGCTRKLDEALLQAAAARGIQIQVQEVLDISYSVRTEIAAAILENTYPLVITSANALRALSLLHQKFDVPLNGQPAFCILGKTSSQATEMGLNVLASAKDSLSLAHCIAQDFAYKQLLHLGSNIDMKRWKAQLQAQGITANTLAVYHKTPAPKTFHAPHGMLFFSPSQVEIFYRTNKLNAQTPAFCIGQTTAAAMAARNHQEIILPNESAAELLMQQVYQYYQIQ